MRNSSFPLNALDSEFKEKLRANFLLSGFAIILGAALGAFFFYAGLQKHLAPFQFAEALMAYQLLPQSLVGVVAATLPWVEIAAGFFLVLGYLLEVAGRIAVLLGFSSGAMLVGGIKRRSCLLLIGALASVFVIVMLVTLARGLQIDCGCGLFFQRQVGAVPIMEDILLLLAAAALYWWEYTGE